MHTFPFLPFFHINLETFLWLQPCNDGLYERCLGNSPCTWHKWGLLHNPCKDSGSRSVNSTYKCPINTVLWLETYGTLTCKSRQSPPLWRRVHRAGRTSSPASVSPGLPEDLRQTGNTPEGEGDPPAWTHLPPQDWARSSDRSLSAPAPSGTGAAPLWCLQLPAIPAAQNQLVSE